MYFNSIEFLLFLPIVFLLYWFVFKPLQWQNLLIVIASYIFYGWWDYRFLVLIAFTSFFSYVIGLLLEQHKNNRRCQLCLSATNIIVNLSVLGVFKYYNFFVDNMAALLATFGFHQDPVTLNIILPVGISFYTFQALSYTIDVYRGNIRASHNPVEFFAYICFFPQLVAGPIERATNLLPQFQKPRFFEYAKAVDGSRQMLWGFFKKMVIADNCAVIVNQYWDNYTQLTGAQLLTVAVLFTFQIYCDFSGYSDIAIGCARLFGINLKRNFDNPYFSRHISEFWRRWHISLMTWFRDYIYFPLGGSRCARWKVIRNTIVVFSISGLWHGANWTYITWGLYHACLIALFIIIGANTKFKTKTVAEGHLLPSLKELLQMSFTFFLAVIGWIIFRANTISQAIDYLAHMFSSSLFSLHWIDGKTWVLASLGMLIIEWFQRDKQHALQFGNNKLFSHAAARYCCYYAIILLILLFSGSSQTFIYFQF